MSVFHALYIPFLAFIMQADSITISQLRKTISLLADMWILGDRTESQLLYTKTETEDDGL